MKFLEKILQFLFPIKCLGCEAPGQELCQKCLSKIPPAENSRTSFIFSVFDYKDPTVQKAILALKVRRSTGLARIFARHIYDHLLEELSEQKLLQSFHDPIIVPIPVSGDRLNDRGFNQTELIADMLLKVDPFLRVEKDVLVKVKDTVKQSTIENKDERKKNIIDAFDIKNEDRVVGKNIVIIDDVTTTGATLQEIKKVLQKAGAKKVLAFTVAH